MNMKEWCKACTDGWAPRKYDNLSRKIQKSLKYNTDPKATVRHHLRDTEEQRKYNDEHYEYWGFNQDGTFEYGKYVIFVTKEEHAEIHRVSEETREKMSASLKMTFSTDEQKLKRSIQRKSEWTDERKREYSEMFSGENSINYGRKASDETRRILSESHKGIKYSEESKVKRSWSMKEYHRLNPCSQETRDKISKAISGKNNPNYGRAYSSEDRAYLSNKSKKSRKAVKLLYDIYKQYGGQKTWNNFQLAIKSGDICFELIKPSILLNNSHNSIIASNKIPFKLTRDRADLYKIYKSAGGTLKWNEFQSYYKQNLNVINTGDEPVKVSTGDKLVQFMHVPVLHTAFQEVCSEDFDKLKPKTDRIGGFGSSGIR